MMPLEQWEITLTNGEVNTVYNKTALCEQYAIILAQAEAINKGMGIHVANTRRLK